MEGILIGAEAFASPVTYMAGLILLGLALSVALLGHVADAERAGRRLFWAEWPITEFRKPEPVEEEAEIRHAA